MGRAVKLLKKLEKNKKKITKNFSKYYLNLQDNPEVFDIIKESPTVKGVVSEDYLDNSADSENITGFSTNASTLTRVDYEFPNENYGLELIVPPGIITASGIRSGHEVEMIGGSLEGRSLEVIEVLNSTTLRLDDVSTFSTQETNVPVKFILN